MKGLKFGLPLEKVVKLDMALYKLQSMHHVETTVNQLIFADTLFRVSPFLDHMAAIKFRDFLINLIKFNEERTKKNCSNNEESTKFCMKVAFYVYNQMKGGCPS